MKYTVNSQGIVTIIRKATSTAKKVIKKSVIETGNFLTTEDLKQIRKP